MYVLIDRYSNYCQNQSKATQAIRELRKTTKFNNFYLSCCKNPSCRGMELPVVKFMDYYSIELFNYASSANSSLSIIISRTSKAYS